MPRENVSLHELRSALDGASLFFVALLILLAWLFPQRIDRPEETASELLVAGVAYLCAMGISRRITSSIAATAVQISAVLLLYSFLFQAVAAYQHVIFNGWMDELLISWEESLTGTELSVLMQQFVNPPLTEWMMFSYMVYVPLLPLVAIICYRSAGPRGTCDYLLALALGYIICYLGFILFPVASPLYHYPELYTVPLEGGLFTWCGEWLRQNGHYPGGSLPSPHCAAATVMMLMLSRYNRKAFAMTLPVVVSIYVAIVYARYHYATDGIAGILVGILAVRLSPSLAWAWGRLARRARTSLCGFATPSSLQVEERRGGK
jgi:membrane-associated phospholipid phosphatase